MKKSFFIFLILLMNTSAFAEIWDLKQFGVGTGTYTQMVGGIQENEEGKLRKFDFRPYLSLNSKLEISSRWNFRPELLWVLPRKAENSNITINVFHLTGDFLYAIKPKIWNLHLGTSLVMQNIKGGGGETYLSNGSSSNQSRYFLPDESRTSFNNTLNLGQSLIINRWEIIFNAYVFSLFESESRQWSYTLGVNYYWDYDPKRGGLY